MSGSIGVQGHYANGLAAIFIACGQDAACVAEAAVGVTRFEERDDGGALCRGDAAQPRSSAPWVAERGCRPSARASSILGPRGPGSANAFAEVRAAHRTGGELSIVGALVAGQFTSAHQSRAR